MIYYIIFLVILFAVFFISSLELINNENKLHNENKDDDFKEFNFNKCSTICKKH